jgi:hypothetical protein
MISDEGDLSRQNLMMEIEGLKKRRNSISPSNEVRADPKEGVGDGRRS